jgi:hypothetical protein
MGTNYYLVTRSNECSACARHDEERLHIGKSSTGWCFSLHVIPERGLNSLDDWKRLWESGGVIENEYGEERTAAEMLSTITDRRFEGAEWTASDLAQNHASRGPNGLARHGYQAKPGPGTWDLCTGEFS